MNNRGDFLVIRPFNGVFIGIFAVLIALMVLAAVILKDKSLKAKKAVLVTASLLTLAGFFVYKYYLSIDVDYNDLMVNRGGFNWWNELPLQLCNINMILIPIAVLLHKKELLAFCFFVGPIGALMALCMPLAEFDGYSILLPRMLGYYGTHFLIVIEGWSIGAFGLYRPRFKDFPRIVFAMFAVSFSVFMINMIMRWTGIFPRANYFYSVETEGNFLLEIFHKWIPVPYLYLMPSIVILLAYMTIVTLGFNIFCKKSKDQDE